MVDKGLTRLRLHNQYSLLDGAISFDELLKQCKKLDMDAVNINDCGNMLVEIYCMFMA